VDFIHRDSGRDIPYASYISNYGGSGPVTSPLKDRRIKLDQQIAELAISLWTVEQTQSVKWTAEGAIIYTYRKEALSVAILTRQRLTVSSAYAEEAFAKRKGGSDAATR